MGVREFRLIWLAQLASVIGDWATRLALAVVVLERTGSATVMSLVVGASLVAWLGPGQLLSQIADVYGRRVVMIVSDLVRAAVFASLVLPVPTWALLVGAAVGGLATPPFAAARSAATRELLPPERYGPAMALASMTLDAGTVAGYAVGGLILTFTSPEGALLVNSLSFVVSALLISRIPESRVHTTGATPGGASGALRAGFRVVFGQPIVRMAVGVTVLASASGVGLESLVVVYNSRDLDGPPWVPGAVLASVAAVSFFVTAMLPNEGVRRGLVRAAGLTALIGAVVSAGGFLTGSHVGALVGFVAAGAFFAVIAPANVVVGPLLPAEVRATAFSVLMGVLVACQSVGAGGAGVLADHLATMHAAALICLPAAVGGAWVLLARAPVGYADDIEAPLPAAVPGVLAGERVLVLPSSPRSHRAVATRKAPAPPTQVGRAQAPHATTQPAPGYSDRT
ncbi:MAG: MFS transporter [Actinomycetes bacterium]